jgi:hypothetical protein
MKSNYLSWIIGAIIVVFGGYYAYITYKPAMAPTTEPAPVTDTMLRSMVITLDTQSGLGQSGMATISDNGDGKAVVTLTMTGGNFPEPQPAHIHLGTCPKPGAVKYPLTNVVAGSSTTTLAISLEELEKSTDKLALNVHKSAAEASVYTACGDLPVAGVTPAPAGDSAMDAANANRTGVSY